MITKELLDYMRAQKASGALDATVDQALKTQGWADADLAQARAQLAPSVPVQTPVSAPVQAPATAPMQAPMQTMAQAMPMGAMNQFNQPAPKSHKGLWVTLVIVLLVLAGSGTAYAYFTGRLTSLSGVMAQAIFSAQQAKGNTFDTTISYEAPSGTDTTGSLGMPFDLSKVTLAIKGSFDRSTPDNPKVQGTITATAGSEGAAAEIRVTNKTIYGQITELPSFATMLGMGDQLSKWYSFDYGSDASTLDSVPFTAQVTSGTSALDKLTADQKAHIGSMTASAHLITITKHMVAEKMDGVLTYHFTFDIDRAGITQYVTDLNTYLTTAGVSETDLAGFDAQNVSSFLDMMKNFKGEAWIGMSDHLARKLTVSYDWGTGSDVTKLAKYNSVVTLTNWNAPLTVQVPPNATSITDMLQQSQTKAADSRTQGEISSLRADAEMYSYDSQSYKGFCASDAAKQEMGDATGFSCHDSASYYVAYAPLSDGTFACSDSKGTQAITSAVSTTGSVCKNIASAPPVN